MAHPDDFRNAQNRPHNGYEDALNELRTGGKQGHWIWYVFPQIVGLGSSTMSEYFGIQGRSEAEAYLRDETLCARLIAAIDVVAAHVLADTPVRLEHLMGSEIDARKLVSSLTLFEAVASDLLTRESDADLAHVASQAHAILDAAAQQSYQRCAFTLRQIRPGQQELRSTGEQEGEN